MSKISGGFTFKCANCGKPIPHLTILNPGLRITCVRWPNGFEEMVHAECVDDRRLIAQFQREIEAEEYGASKKKRK